MKNLLKIVESSIQGENGKGSSRRISLYLIIALLIYVCVRFTNIENIVTIATILSSLILSLAGVKAYQQIKNNGKDTSQSN